MTHNPQDIASFLDATLTAGATKAYLTPEEYDAFMLSPRYAYDFKKTRYKYNKGRYKRKLLVVVK